MEAEIIALKEHYENIIQREAKQYQQQIEKLTYQLTEEKKRNALLEAELINYLRDQSPNKSDSRPSTNDDKAKIVSVQLIDTRDMKEKDGNRRFTAYVLNVQNSLGEQYTIHKRYKQFEVLHFLLSRRFSEVVPELPPKHELAGKTHKIAKRKTALQDYCNEIIANSNFLTFSPVLDFFRRE